VPTDEYDVFQTNGVIALLRAVRKQRALSDKKQSPLLIHCSAGIGRTGMVPPPPPLTAPPATIVGRIPYHEPLPLTLNSAIFCHTEGTLIVIDYIISAVRFKDAIDVVKVVDAIRNDRMCLVQHTEQYRFVRCAFSTEIYTRGCNWFQRLLANHELCSTLLNGPKIVLHSRMQLVLHSRMQLVPMPARLKRTRVRPMPLLPVHSLTS
jgi:hypothetical protein